MATYKEIQNAVKCDADFVPKTCWIAHVLSDHGLATRQAYNRVSPAARKHPCPADKRHAIENALRRFGMI